MEKKEGIEISWRKKRKNQINRIGGYTDNAYTSRKLRTKGTIERKNTFSRKQIKLNWTAISETQKMIGEREAHYVASHCASVQRYNVRNFINETKRKQKRENCKRADRFVMGKEKRAAREKATHTKKNNENNKWSHSHQALVRWERTKDVHHKHSENVCILLLEC